MGGHARHPRHRFTRAVLLSPDEKTLYVADGEPRPDQRRELRAYPIAC
jgi:sugar lactone lactonase YvrE